MVGQLTDHTLLVKNSIAHTSSYHPGNFVKEACVKQAAWQSVCQEHLAMTTKGAYIFLSCDKPDNVVCMMYKNFSSLSLFAEGPKKQVKICQLNKLLRDFGIDVIAGCETRTDWRFVTKEESRFVNLFGNRRPTRGSSAHNINDPKIMQDQWGGTCITALGQFSFFVTATGIDSLGLMQWSWLYISGGGKNTCILIAYQPGKPGNKTRGETVWDQQVGYFESCGEVRQPRLMFQADLLNLIRTWKTARDKIILLGGKFALDLLGNKFRMSELCLWTTGSRLPNTHI